jgi:hypothetical protein
MGTKKCQDAEEKGIEIVDEDWVRNMIEGSNSEEPSKKAKPSEVAAAAPGGGGDRLSGHCYAISGSNLPPSP